MADTSWHPEDCLCADCERERHVHAALLTVLCFLALLIVLFCMVVNARITYDHDLQQTPAALQRGVR